MKRVRAVRILPLLTMLGATACSSKNEEPPPPPANSDVVLNANARVIDEAQGALVSSYDAASGKLCFRSTPPALEGVAPGYVLVSGIIPDVAPKGFLRKVTGVNDDGGGLCVTSTQAALTELFDTVKLDLSTTLEGEEAILMPLAANVDGFARTGSGLLGAHPSEIPPARGYHIDFHNFGFSLAGQALNVDGNVVVDPTFILQLEMQFGQVRHFVCSMRLNERTDVQINAHVSATLAQREEEVFSITFSSIIITAGPVVIVLTPRMEMDMGVSLSAALDLSMRVQNAAEGIIGTEYTQSRGWVDLTESVAEGSLEPPPALTAGVTLEVYPKIDWAIELYDLTGPHMYQSTGIQLDVATPRDPFITAGVHMQLGAGYRMDLFGLLDIFDASGTYFDHVFEFFHTDNFPPITAIATPPNGLSVRPDEPIHFTGAVYDLEEGLPDDRRVHAVWTDETGVELGRTLDFTRVLNVRRPGPFTIYLTGSDSQNMSTRVPSTLQIQNIPPSVSINAPLPGATVYTGRTLQLTSHVTDFFFPGEDICMVPGFSIRWSSRDALGTITPLVTTGCPTSEVTFDISGDYTIILEVTDPFGTLKDAAVDIHVEFPPPNVFSVSVDLPAPGSYTAMNGHLDPALTLFASAFGTPSPVGVLTYSWTGTTFAADGTTLYRGPVSIGATNGILWEPIEDSTLFDPSVTQTMAGQRVQLDVHITDEGGNFGDGSVSVYIIDSPG